MRGEEREGEERREDEFKEMKKVKKRTKEYTSK